MSLSMPPFLQSVVDWLRAGYPQGVPEADYIPLLAVLSRRLSSDDILVVTGALVQQGSLPIDNADIGVIITRLTDEMPRKEDVLRVRSHLAAGGWPLA